MPADVVGFNDFSDLYAAWVLGLPEDAVVVEVGSYLGASAIDWARIAQGDGRLTPLICIDTFTGGVPEDRFQPGFESLRDHQRAILARDGSLFPEFQRNTEPYRRWITSRRQDSLTAAASFAPGSVDAAFLDDDHETAHVSRELEAWWPTIKPGGTLAGHDWDWPSVREAVHRFSARVGVPIALVSSRCWSLRKPGPITSWTVPPAVRTCLVAVCTNERSIYRQTAESLMRVGWGQRLLAAMTQHGFADITLHWETKYPTVDAMREDAALLALRTHHSHILWLDADMTWPGDLLTRMLRHHAAGMVSGTYHLKTWPHWPVALSQGRPNASMGVQDYTYDEHLPLQTTLQPVELVGMGCLLTPTVLFRALPRPWFEYRRNAETGLTTITEDVAFCEAVRTLGCPVLVDPTVRCGHIGQPIVGLQDFQRATFDRAWFDADRIPPLPHEVPASRVPREVAS